MSTIKSASEIDAIFRSSTRVAHPLLIALVARTPEGRGPQGRVAFIAGKRLGHAAVRNRCKRVVRAAVREAGGPWSGFDVVLIATARTHEAKSWQLAPAIHRIEQRLGQLGRTAVER